MEEQYGERYTVKLEERLFHYLEELNKALRQPTYIDQVKPCAMSHVFHNYDYVYVSFACLFVFVIYTYAEYPTWVS